MKMNCWLMLCATLATSAIAQDNTNALPPIPAPITSPTQTMSAPAVVDTNAPAVEKKSKPAKHKRRKPAAAASAPITEPTVALVPGPATVDVKNINVRGQVGLKGEVVAHLNQGETVTVLDQINLDKHKAGEPAQWAKIALPASTHVWVYTAFVDATSKTVLPKKLNLRAGPGENYSVLGVIDHGTPVTEITTKDKWMQIAPPANAYAFVAAMYLKQEAVAATPVPEPQPVAPAPAQPVIDTNPPTTTVVSREGVVGPVASIVAPTAFKLYDPQTYQTIDYLYTTETNLDFSRYNNMRIIVTGEEALDERWKNTPVLTVESIQVIDTNVVKVIPIKHNH